MVLTNALPKVYLIVLNYQSWQDTIECLESIFELDYQNKVTIVVDNNSPNNSYELLVNWATTHTTYLSTASSPEKYPGKTITMEGNECVFLKSEENKGFAAGNNLGIRYCLQQGDFEYLWLVNNDTVLDRFSLKELVTQAQLDYMNGLRHGIWGSKLTYYHDPATIQALGGKFNTLTFTSKHLYEGVADHKQFDKAIIAQDYVVGASLFVSRSFIEEIGILNERYFLYFEELDWAYRAKLKGFTLGFVGTSKVLHKEGKTIGSSTSGGKKSFLADYHGNRSKIIFIKTYYPWRKAQLYFLLTASAILKLIRWQPKRALMILNLMMTSRSL